MLKLTHKKLEYFFPAAIFYRGHGDQDDDDREPGPPQDASSDSSSPSYRTPNAACHVPLHHLYNRPPASSSQPRPVRSISPAQLASPTSSFPAISCSDRSIRSGSQRYCDYGGHGRAVDDGAAFPFPEPRPQHRPADGAAGGSRGHHQGPRGGGLHVRQEKPRGRGAGGGAPARGRREQAARRDAPRARGQVRRAAGQGHRHDGRRGRQPAPPVVDHVRGRLGRVAVQEARPQRQPRHRRRPPQPFASARRGRERRLRRHRRRQPRPDGVHVRPRAMRQQQARPRRRVQAQQGHQALRPRRPRRPQPRCEGRVPMAEIWAEGDQGQPVPEGLLPVLLRAGVPGEEEGAAQRRGHNRAGGDVRGRPQPRPAHRQARRRQEERRLHRLRPNIATGGGRTTTTAAAAATEAGGRGRGGEEEPCRADGGDADEGSRVSGGARQRALRPDPRVQIQQLIGKSDVAVD